MAGRRLFRRAALIAAAALVIPVGGAIAAPAGSGAPGIGDPYYPDYGNGGYDVRPTESTSPTRPPATS